MFKRAMIVSGAMLALPWLVGCNVVHHAGQWESVDRLVAVIHPTEGNQCRGTVWFTQQDDGVKITAQIHGLKPGAQHAIHIHDYGDATSPDGKSAGDHYNPQKMAHGRPEDKHRHAGDFGNLPAADSNGSVRFERMDKVISLVGVKNPIVGRSVVVHAGQDKFVQPTGDAGPRIGVGVIGIAQPKSTAKPAGEKKKSGS